MQHSIGLEDAVIFDIILNFINKKYLFIKVYAF